MKQKEDAMVPVFSIIIPVYNAEKYLDKAVESVLNQSIGVPFELILVNDGSRDGSAEICDRYALQDQRIRVIHQENQGVSVARNTGIAAARGIYVLFLDSDDLLDGKLMETVDQFIPLQADMIEFGWNIFSDAGVKKTNLLTCKACGETGEEYLQKHEKSGVMPIVSCWAAAFRRQFLVENQLLFPVGISYGEDFRFCMQCIKKAEAIYTVDQALYWYRVNESSVTHTPNVKKIRDVLQSCAEMYRLFPSSLLADYYCLSIWNIEGLKRQDAVQVYGLLQENRDILKQVTGARAKLARGLYSVFGWYGGAKMLRTLANIQKRMKG